MKQIRNHTYDELNPGDSASFKRTLTEEDVLLFAKVSGDLNPLHLDEDYAKTTLFKGRIAHGMWAGSIISAGLANVLPGPGTIYLSQKISFRSPIRIGDEITVTLSVVKKHANKNKVTIDCQLINQKGKRVAYGNALVIAPFESLCIEQAQLPEVKIASET